MQRNPFLQVFCIATGLALTPLAGCSCEGPPGLDGGPGVDGGPGLGSGQIESIEPAAAELTLPFDAAPSPDASVIYFTALGNAGGHALFRVPADGSAAPVEVASGFVSPLGLVVSSRGDVVFVADSGYETGEDDETPGAILEVSSAGAVTVIAETDGYQPRGIDLRREGSADVIVFSGRDPSTNAPGVFRLEGRDLRALAVGEGLSDPSGVAIASDGTVYVVDTSGGTDLGAAILAIEDGSLTPIVESGITVGYPAGLALVQDESALFVSGMDYTTSQAVVLRVELSDNSVLSSSAGIEGNDEAGGIHRAHDVDAYVWAGTSTVYLLR